VIQFHLILGENKSLEVEASIAGEDASTLGLEEEFLGAETALMRTRLSDIEEGDEDELESLQNQIKSLQNQLQVNKDAEFDEEAGESAFMAQYNEEYGHEMDEYEDNVQPRGKQ
jgi:hypothetical protein